MIISHTLVTLLYQNDTLLEQMFSANLAIHSFQKIEGAETSDLIE